jgi:hypothetical protein
MLNAAGMEITSSIIFVFVRLDDAFCRLKHDPGTANQHRPRTHAKSARSRASNSPKTSRSVGLTRWSERPVQSAANDDELSHTNALAWC